MADPNFFWVYLLIFLAIPLSRIIPRFIARRRQEQSAPRSPEKHAEQFGTSQSERPAEQFGTSQSERPAEQFGTSQSERPASKGESAKPQTNEMLVLRKLHQGANTFEKIQKYTGLDSRTLDSVLESLEKNGLIKVVQKQGMFGPKVELYSTDKGLQEYHS